LYTFLLTSIVSWEQKRSLFQLSVNQSKTDDGHHNQINFGAWYPTELLEIMTCASFETAAFPNASTNAWNQMPWKAQEQQVPQLLNSLFSGNSLSEMCQRWQVQYCKRWRPGQTVQRGVMQWTFLQEVIMGLPKVGPTVTLAYGNEWMINLSAQVILG